MAGVTSTIALIQAIAAGIPGVKLAPSRYPASVNTSDLPMALTWAGPATSQPLTFGIVKRKSVRTYDVAVFVEALGQDIGHNRIAAANTMLQAFLDAFLTNTQLAANLRITDEIRDTGVVTGDSSFSGTQARLIYNGQAFTGFVISLVVNEIMAV
jgi:hypothetical protein